MQPLLESIDSESIINRELHGFEFSSAAFVNEQAQAQDVQKIYQDLQNKIKNGDINGVRYLLGIDPFTSNQMQPIHIYTIVDEKKNTLLMETVLKDQNILFIDLITYSLKQFGFKLNCGLLNKMILEFNVCIQLLKKVMLQFLMQFLSQESNQI
ncbi:unnamed protein product [Paramecium sonneborni]|uniref:Uncharacterized protein n=1 Tax=Paramecium sonneborni TaxID=65129 RepID=A0A8S1LMX5_9CILI|nr:unnamed protein product [Paramecium sonneborni]